MNSIKMKPCPLCGMHPDMDGDDTIYPVSGWRLIEEDGDTFPVYIDYLDVLDMRSDYPECFGIYYGFVYTMHCVENHGGCGMEVSGNSKEEAIARWNRRTPEKE
ncbi:MAG TPA: hypothetical protein VFM18_12720 [Methanosarcina sp.]|nr:hypothetical protein [Methanosarcina sp.]